MYNPLTEMAHRLKTGKTDMYYEFNNLLNLMHLVPKQDWTGIDKYFIISTGRTGTKFLARFINGFDSTLSLHEPHPDFVNLGVDYASGKVSEEKASRRIERGRRVLCKLVKKQGASRYVEPNNRLFSLIDVLEKVFDDIKIIHIVRDGRDYVRSGMSRGWYKEVDIDIRLEASEFEDDEYRDRWEEMSRFEKICWRWQKKDGFIYRSLEGKDNYIRVKFEDIFEGDNYTGLKKICEYMNIPKKEVKRNIELMMDNKINATKEYEIPHWSEWGKEMIETFEEIAGEHMKRYYEYGWNQKSG